MKCKYCKWFESFENERGFGICNNKKCDTYYFEGHTKRNYLVCEEAVCGLYMSENFFCRFFEKREDVKIEEIERLKELQKYEDIEEAHIEADKILCKILEELGLTEVVDEYKKVPKWYA